MFGQDDVGERNGPPAPPLRTNLTPGNKSDRMPLNSGTSWSRNLGRLTSLMARSISTSSATSGKLRFRLPAARSTDMTARMPAGGTGKRDRVRAQVCRVGFRAWGGLR